MSGLELKPEIRVFHCGPEEAEQRHDGELVEEEEEVEEEESKGEGSDEERDLVGIFERHAWRPVQYVMYSCLMVEELVDELLWIIKEQLCKSFYPVLQQAISVGTSFAGWFPCDDDAVYQLLLPLKAPRGHTFNLELGTMREMPAGDPCIRVELECTCTGQQMEENMLCFLHHSKDITKNQDPSLLHTLCTGCYLDVHKTARWFQNLMMSAWRDVPHLRHYNMKTLPSNQSCRLELTSASGKTFFIELIFGVQHGDSDIFLSIQAPEDTSTPSTTWPVTYAAAEVTFFKYMARQVPTGRVHLKCLHHCAYILMGTSFSTYTFKTAVMHLLTTILLSDWHSKYSLLRLRDIMPYVLCCLEKCLKHFFLGNENMPEEISLPPSFRTAKPLSLFQRFTQDPAAYAEALHDFKQLQYRLVRAKVSCQAKALKATIQKDLEDYASDIKIQEDFQSGSPIMRTAEEHQRQHCGQHFILQRLATPICPDICIKISRHLQVSSSNEVHSTSSDSGTTSTAV
ncbi:inositol 1,4,5-trisphosphate receptor-interacting protein-like 1 [Phaenicophaeus curvirostris]|uniref:inositol 1,4,5-trisphosphate receptor-interacting protein-like 1 n=1 Tax=Phaenicophaeus curvirostris TaxID=33595 RepID=UPI0037F0DA36